MVIGLTSSYILVALKFGAVTVATGVCIFSPLSLLVSLSPISFFERVLIELSCQQVAEMKKTIHSSGLRCGSVA